MNLYELNTSTWTLDSIEARNYSTGFNFQTNIILEKKHFTSNICCFLSFKQLVNIAQVVYGYQSSLIRPQ